jgi:hypothetical protein
VQLKEELNNIKRRDYTVPENYNYMHTATRMLEEIGSTDDELRDELIYFTYSHWILQGCFKGSELRELLSRVLDDRHMFYKMGESHTDSVFTRSFSVLLIPLILLADQGDSFLTTEDIDAIKDSLIHFLRSERDLRGYVDGKGWAHSIAHAADGIDELFKRKLAQTDISALMEAIRDAVCTRDTTYINLEDERLVTAVLTILKHEELDSLFIRDWLYSFTRWEKTEYSHEEHKIISNVKNFLATLYFRLSAEGYDNELVQTVKQVRLELMKPYT